MEECNIFGLLQVKRELISSIVNFIYDLLHEYPNDIRLRNCPRHFRRWAGLHAHTRKKKKDLEIQKLGSIDMYINLLKFK